MKRKWSEHVKKLFVHEGTRRNTKNPFYNLLNILVPFVSASCPFVDKRMCLIVFAFCFMAPAAHAQSSMDFYRDLARKPQATIGDAVHAVARAEGYAGPVNLWGELVWLHKERGVTFRRDVAALENVALTKGNAAHMLMSALGVKGWVMQRIFKGSQRYALREAVYQKLLPAESTVHQKMSGNELLGFLSRVVEHTERRGIAGSLLRDRE